MIVIALPIIPVVVSTIIDFSLDVNYNKYGLRERYFFIAHTFLIHVNNVIPRKLSNKIAVLTMIFGGTLIYKYWEANFEAMLAIKRMEVPLQTLSELSQNSKYKFITSQGTVYVDRFSYSVDPIYIKIWEEKMMPYIELSLWSINERCISVTFFGCP